MSEERRFQIGAASLLFGASLVLRLRGAAFGLEPTLAAGIATALGALGLAAGLTALRGAEGPWRAKAAAATALAGIATLVALSGFVL